MILLLLPLLVGLGLLGAMVLAVRWFAGANTQKLAESVKQGGNAGLVLVGLFLLLRGRVGLGITLIGAGLGRMSGGNFPGNFPGGFSGGAGGGFGGFGGGFPGGGFPGAGGFGGGPFGPFGDGRRRTRRSAGTGSTVRTASLEATLDHDSGDMDATVLKGRFQGRRFSGMILSELIVLWREMERAGEADSRLLVEAYLDRLDPAWRESAEVHADSGAQGSGGTGRFHGGSMSEQEAYEVLGLRPGASEGEVRASHRRLMKQMHPDHGGTSGLAARLNEARDVLLGRR